VVKDKEMKRKKTRAFIMSIKTASQFFKLVKYFTDNGYKDTEKLRKQILDELARAGQMSGVFETNRTQDQIVADYRKHGLTIDDRRLPKGGLNVSSWAQSNNKRSSVGRFFRELGRVFKVLFLGGSK